MKCNVVLMDDGESRCALCSSNAGERAECLGVIDCGQSSCLAGTALKSLLGAFGINSTPACSCDARAREMDAYGCDWCAANEGLIVGWMRQEADKRGILFIDAAARLLVRRAIRNARRAAAS